MKLRSLDNPIDQLIVFRQPDGDIQVTIHHNTKDYKSSYMCGVRVGGCGSGHSVPRKIWQLLNELATEFEKYEDCENEQQAYWKEEEKEEQK